MICRWCPNEFEPFVRGGQEKLYCSRKCRGEYNASVRAYTQTLIDMDAISIETLKRVLARRKQRAAG